MSRVDMLLLYTMEKMYHKKHKIKYKFDFKLTNIQTYLFTAASCKVVYSLTLNRKCVSFSNYRNKAACCMLFRALHIVSRPWPAVNTDTHAHALPACRCSTY